MPGFNPAGWQNASDVISQNQPANNSGWLDRVLGRVDDGFDIYDRVRCAANPTAPGCYQNNGASGAGGVPPPNNTWLYVGLGVVLLLVIGIVIIALKK
jgi:hypothetical protein